MDVGVSGKQCFTYINEHSVSKEYESLQFVQSHAKQTQSPGGQVIAHSLLALRLKLMSRT